MYRIFKRSVRNFEDFSRARKITMTFVDTIEQARAFCEDYNRNRTYDQKRRGTKYEFESA